ncbi:hypothetical protein M422DRAFT_246559 [Sphaerobolus stellatus SS14]|nr:hypothetical protein M422DRAFT_246559 [Sphaerobolus stellatus SS14]
MSFPPRGPTPPPTYEHPASLGTTLRPYLTLPYILSLSWLAYPVISLLFVAFRLQLSLSSAEDSVADVKNDLLASCQAAQHAATAAASMPRYMAIGTNNQIITAVNDTMNGAREALILALTVMEAIINFIVDTYRSTFLCFLELVVRGGLSILISAVQELQSFVTSTLGGIRTSIQNDVTSANSAITTIVNGVNKVNPFSPITAPQLNVPSLDSLNNVTLPTDFEQALLKLNASIPSLSELRSAIDDITDTPFELVKKDINETFFGYTFNETLLTVPSQNSLTFCNQLDTSVVDNLGVELVKVARIGVLLLIALALIVLAGQCLWDWYKWRSLRRHLQRTREAWATDPTVYRVTAITAVPTVEMSDHNLLTLHATSTHPLLTLLANKISTLCRLSSSQYIHLQFFFHYAFHPPALACFLIGFFGLLSVELQLLALGPVQARFTKEVSTSVADFSNTISTSINASMFNQSAEYADSINGHVFVVQNGVNDGLFGWVNATTTTLNTTIATFYSDVQNAVETVFGGTILEEPAQEFIRCILGTKVDAIEKALTFLHDNLHVDLPTVDRSVLVLSPDHVDEITTPISQAAVGGGPDNKQGLVGRLIDRYVAALKKERIMFAIFIGLWMIVVIMALCIIFYHSYGKAWMEAKKRKRFQMEQRGHVDPIARPWYHESDVAGGDIKEKDLASFTPTLESPQRTGFFAALRKAAQKERGGEKSDEVVSEKKGNKLMAIGRKAFGRETLVRDQDSNRVSDPEALHPRVGPNPLLDNPSNRAEHFEVEIREERGKPWWNRLLPRRGSDESFSSGENQQNIHAPEPLQPPQSQQRSRHYPNPSLTIETNILLPASQRQKLPVVVQDAPSPQESKENLNSRFSVSPAVTKPVPWKPLPAMPANTLPLRPNKPRMKINVPQEVNSTYGPSVLQSGTQRGNNSKANPVPNPFANAPNPFADVHNPFANVPIHHGFVRPIPANTPSTPSPPTSPHGPTAALAPPSFNQGMVENPFATCFDDEHRVKDMDSAPIYRPQRPPSNPFMDMVGTPRAV